MLLVAGWLGHDSNIEAQPPGLCYASPRQACGCGGLEEGADAQALGPFHCSSPCVPEKLGSEGRAWAPEAPMEHRAW